VFAGWSFKRSSSSGDGPYASLGGEEGRKKGRKEGRKEGRKGKK